MTGVVLEIAYWLGRFARCLQALVSKSNMDSMNALEGRLVLVRADQLDDLLELTRLACDRLPDDQLARSLKASLGQVRLSQLIEP